MKENTTPNPINDRVAGLFVQARQMQSLAVERLEAGDIRDAAGKAWCATQRATDALILARTGEKPESEIRTSDGLDDLSSSDRSVASLNLGYYSRIHHLRDMCFQSGHWNDGTADYIRNTEGYIAQVEGLARQQGGTGPGRNHRPERQGPGAFAEQRGMLHDDFSPRTKR